MSTHPSSVHERVSASRKKYAISAVIGVVLALSWFFVAWYGLEGRYFVIVDRYLDIGDRLAYVAKWMTGPGLCLLVSVVMVANVRAFTPAIDPLETDLEEKDERAIHVWRNITTNTTEQNSLAVDRNNGVRRHRAAILATTNSNRCCFICSWPRDLRTGIPRSIRLARYWFRAHILSNRRHICCNAVPVFLWMSIQVVI